MTFELIWGSLSFILAVFVAVLMVAWKMPRRRYFALRVVASLIVITAYRFAFSAIMHAMDLDFRNALLIYTLDSLVIYILSLICVGVCFKSNVWAMLFCATAGYCMQHMSQRAYIIFVQFVFSFNNMYANAVLLTAITALFYVVAYYLFIKNADYRGVMIDNKVQILVSAVAIAVTIFLNSYAMKAIGYGENGIYVMLFSLLTAVLIVYIEFGWLAAKKEEIEKNVMQRMSREAQAHYHVEKQIVDMINIKAHDLKHQISALGGRITDSEIKSIRKTISIYDSMMTTGNPPLDVTLTGKAMACEKSGISFTCLVDGAKITYLSEAEIYSLFGNVMDNAIEAVSQLQDPEKKIISLTSRVVGDRIVIMEENYFVGTKQIENGFPVTTKGDDRNHGFGLKSINYICKKHGGECSVDINDDRFEIKIVLPIKQ